MNKFTLLVVAVMLTFFSAFAQIEEVSRATNTAANLSSNATKVNWGYTNTWVGKGTTSRQGFAYFATSGMTTKTPESVGFNFEYLTLDPNNASVEVEFFYKTAYTDPRWSSINYPTGCVTLGTMTIDTVGNYQFTSTALDAYVQANLDANTGFNIIMRTTTENSYIGVAGKVGGVFQPTLSLYSSASSQTITFDAIDAVLYSEAVPITLSATASSGLPVSYVSSNPSVATVSGNIVTPVAMGKATITASQAGDGSYDAADDVEQEVYYAPEEITYYVREAGDDVNDGLSVGNAMATITAATTAAVADGGAISYVIDVDGTTQGAASIVFNRAQNISYSIQGASAGASILQMTDDAAFATVIASSGLSAGRFFQTPKNGGAGNLDITIDDVTIRNFGFTNTNGGGLFNMTSADEVSVTMKNCNILRGAARAGAILQTTNGTGTFTLENCFVSEQYTINNGGLYISPIYVKNGRSFVAKNCVFSSFEKLAGFGTAYAKAEGSVLTFLPNVVTSSLSLVNNTFVGDSILESNMTLPQSAIYIKSEIADAPVTIANNIFVGNSSLSISQPYYDVHVDAASSALALINSTNNVMASQLGLGTDGNNINPLYYYTSIGINFFMNVDGDFPEEYTSASGLSYVKVNGDEIFQTGLASVAPATDIIGTTRANPPCVGAFEATEGIPTGLVGSISSNLAVYPNPVQDMLYIQGDIASVSIYNISGVLVSSVSNTTEGISVSHLNRGIYLVKCEDANGAVLTTQRIMKK